MKRKTYKLTQTERLRPNKTTNLQFWAGDSIIGHNGTVKDNWAKQNQK